MEPCRARKSLDAMTGEAKLSLGDKMMKEKTILYTLSTCILLTVIFYSLFGLSKLWLGTVKSKAVMEEVQQVYEHQIEAYESMEEDQREEPIINPLFYELLEINEEVVGWLRIPNTVINYPVVQAEDNEYYLSRNLKKETSSAGSIFMDYRNNLSMNSPHTILYGHRMKDGTMFGQLTQFLNEDFLKKHSHFQFETLTESYDLEIFSIYITTTDFDYIKTSFEHGEEYAQFLQQIKQKSYYEMDVDVAEEDYILTLSTCDYTLDVEDGRLVIHAIIKK